MIQRSHCKVGWGAKTQSQESHCLHRAQLLFLHTEQYGPGNKGGRKNPCRLNHGPGQWEVLSPRSWLGISPRTEASLATSISRWLPTSQGSESLGPERHLMPHSSPVPPLHSMELQKWLLPAQKLQQEDRRHVLSFASVFNLGQVSKSGVTRVARVSSDPVSTQRCRAQDSAFLRAPALALQCSRFSSTAL